MPISGVANRLIASSYAAEPGPVKTECKASFLGRIVYRVTYPARQLVSNIVMTTYSWVKSAVERTQKALDERSCLIKVPLTILAGTGAFIGGLVAGTVVGATCELGTSVIDALCEDDMDELDTLLERKINQALHKSDENMNETPAPTLRTT